MNSNSSILLGTLRPDLLKDETLAELFRASAKTHLSKTALICRDQALSYAELDRWSDAVAASLASQGIGRGASVGVWWPRGLELHVIILAIVKSGAAYVPLDFEMPAERVVTVLSEVKAAACFSPKTLELNCPTLSVPPLMGPENTKIPLHPPFSKGEIGPQFQDWAYVLYTSGSTGKPKGIPITHSQICHLVRAEQSVLGLRSEDKVYQGFSVSFDMWCEETWISYLVGATLFVADAEMAKSIDELSEVLSNNNITVLHAVPSLLAVIDEHIPSLRLVNAGGEACTASVLARWGKPPLQFFNTYGPTETTVTATIAALKSGEAITIGQPLPNYDLAIVDEALNPLPYGQRGELVISGPGVGQGYINLVDLTREKFVKKPALLAAMRGEVIYRSGDAALMDAEQNIYIQGRFDDQIKLRGYRIELGEIEVRLNQLPGISAAAVAVKKDKQGNDHLVAYLRSENQKKIEETELRNLLAKELPVYMLPSLLVQLNDLPRLASGKIDRKVLPTPEALLHLSEETQVPLDKNAPLRERVVAVLQKVFPNRSLDLSQDFFDDLGGHSLLAAGFVSRMRNEAGVEQASIRDVYLNRPLAALVEKWETKTETKSAVQDFQKVPAWRYLLCGLGQSVALLFIFALFAVQIFLPYLAYYYVLQESSSHLWSIVTALFSFCFIPPFFSSLTIVSKWLVLGRVRAGDYPLWGGYYFRWWFVKTMQRLTPIEYINGTPLYAIYLRLLGVKIASDAQLSAFTIAAEDLVTIGKDVSISSGAVMNNAVVEGGLLKLRAIHIADHAYIGTSAVIAGGCRIEEWGELKDLSFLRPNTVLKTREVWGGSPAIHQTTKSPEELPQPLEVSPATLKKYSKVYLLLLLIFPFTILLPLLPSIIALNALDNYAADYDFSYLVLTPLLSLSYILLFALEAIFFTRLLQHGLQPGTYPVYSRTYLKKWFSDQIMTLSLFVLHPAYATVFVSTLYRALGAKIGKNAEISTASQVTHRLLEIGNGAFVADVVVLGEDDVRGQRLTLSRTSIGNNSFVGNSALIPQGYHLPDNMLVGVLSVPPTPEQLQSSDAKNWFGSPAIPLPRRQESKVFPPELTTHPTKKRRLARGLVELIRILIPSSAVMSFSVLFIAYGHDLLVGDSWWRLIYQFPLYYLFFVGIPSLLVTVILKWLLIGKHRPAQVPLWSWKVWCSEAITSTYEALTVPFLLEYLQGTPWLPLVLRLFGVRTGKRVWLNTTDITEFDVVNIGDDAALNDESGPQTHLFEDRVMKIGPVKIGARSSIGARSVVLYDSYVGEDSNLEALSLVMKGENLPAHSNWGGSPVRQG
ncbi:MAG: amino acid adenylation domain-containing protein [Deltaproteobacteria bacterium]|nr:amino acid adenylation domain-containing protein [Deltaproteobacteria bacterium]